MPKLGPDQIVTVKSLSTNVLKEGYLTKFGGHGIGKNWRYRWFILTKDGRIFYFKTNLPDSAALGYVLVSDYSAVMQATEETKKPLCFKLCNTNDATVRPFYMYANKKADMESWIATLSGALANRDDLATAPNVATSTAAGSPPSVINAPPASLPTMSPLSSTPTGSPVASFRNPVSYTYDSRKAGSVGSDFLNDSMKSNARRMGDDSSDDDDDIDDPEHLTLQEATKRAKLVLKQLTLLQKEIETKRDLIAKEYDAAREARLEAEKLKEAARAILQNAKSNPQGITPAELEALKTTDTTTTTPNGKANTVS